MNVQLEVKDVAIAYAGVAVVEGISFQLQRGEIGCLLGPSGCGKTTLLRAISGFETINHGEIHLHGQPVSRPGKTVPPETRRIGMVFQDFALFPHLSVSDNVGFGLRKMARKEKRGRIDELLEMVGLADFGNKYPHQLSGGQQQRVALVRAMAPRPEILLMDEPFSSMDMEMREQLAQEVRDILKTNQVTAIMVTHDQMEAFAMADHICILGEGRMRQWGTGYELYHKPADRFVADFIGQGVMLPGVVQGYNRVEMELGVVSGTIPPSCEPDCTVHMLIRPDDIIHDDDSPIRVRIVGRAFRGAAYQYTLELPSGAQIYCLVQSHHDHPIGEELGIRLNVEHLNIFTTT